MRASVRAARAKERQVAVYQIMTPHDTFDIILISVIENMLNTLITRNKGDRYKTDRLEAALAKVDEVQEKIGGFIPKNHQDRAEKFIKYMYADLNSLQKDLPAQF
jgi:hypothetical protein